MRRPKRDRRRNFLPQTESLEPRITLSADIGVNLQSNGMYNEDPIWTDLHNLSTTWQAPGSVPMTADGYPLANDWTWFTLANYPDGNYQFSYTGTATLAFSDIGQLAGPVTVSGGVTSGTVSVNHQAGDHSALVMNVAGVNPASPMDNFHLMMPGYGNGTTPVPMYTPAFLKQLQPFSNIRFMDFGNTNGSTLANWSDRVPANAFITGGDYGVPYEDMIELCNESQKDMWINIPALATPSFVQDLSQLIQSRLDSNLNVYVEYSNETWNWYFTQFPQIWDMAKTNPLVTEQNPQLMIAQQCAYQEVQFGNIFKQAFAGESSRVRPIMAAFACNSSIASTELQFIQQNYGPPSQYVWATAIAPYTGITASVPGITVDQVFAELNQYLLTTDIPNIQANASVARSFGVQMAAYETGQGVVPGNNGLNYAVLAQAENDPRMGQVELALFRAWNQAGGGVYDEFELTGIPGPFGFWGMLPNVLSNGTQRYDALISLLVPSGDANLDGVVDFADFQALQANYNRVNAYWEQGDFNDDGVVNWQDLNLLRQDLNPAGFTLAQFAQQAVSGEPATLSSPTGLEYDGYGVTYAGSLPFAASSGTVNRNQDSQGHAILLGGATYSQGLGVLANSSVSLALNGQFSRYESTIGVGGGSDTGSAVIFDAYGDGKLLYQSPAMTYASGAVPIDVDVSGVTTLSLVVSPAPGTNSAGDHAVWADARMVSTANFGTTTPYSLTWQLSQNGAVLSTRTSDSFAFGALSGTYTITLTAADGQGHTATASSQVTVYPTIAMANLSSKDGSTQGNWIGRYGTQGYDVVGNGASLPSYATVTTSGATTYAWPKPTGPQALQTADGSNIIAAAWYSATTFSVNLNLTDGKQHLLSIYADDYDNAGRSERIQVVDATTNTVLDTESISSFSGGIYLDWRVSGNVAIRVTDLGKSNAVISGLFLDAASGIVWSGLATQAAWSGASVATQGNWIGTFGSQGYDILGNGSSLPSYATITSSGATSYTWPSTTDPRALQDAVGTGRIASAWYSSTSFSVDVNLTDGQQHLLSIYAVDFDHAGRSEQIQIINAATGVILNTTDLSSFSGGAYLQWEVSGHIVIKVTDLAGPNAVLSGLFLDPGINIPSQLDTTTKGNWIGTYGGQGYDILGNGSSLPSYATITSSGTTSYTWPSTTDPRALQDAVGTGRIASAWYSSTSFSVDVNLTDGQQHLLSIYAVDFDSGGRSERVQILDAATGSVINTTDLSSFSGGVYLEWEVGGNIVIKVTDLAGPNAVISGLFLDAKGGPAPLSGKLTPTITWSSPAGIVYGTPLSSAQLDATSDVAGTFTYSSAAGTILHAGLAQRLTATFTPADTADYAAVTAATMIDVAQATPAIAWPSPAGIAYGTPLSSAQLDATSVAAGTFTYWPAAGTVLHAGSGQPLSVTFTPADTADYTVVTASVPIDVAQATATIAWPSPAGIVYGTPLSSAQLDATSVAAGTFTYSPAAGTILGVGAAQPLSVTFTPTDTADCGTTTVTASTTIDVAQATPTIVWANPASIAYGTPLSSAQLDAASVAAGTYTYSPAAGTVLGVGAAQRLSVTFTPTDTADYGTAAVTAVAMIDVVKASPTIVWPSPAGILYRTPLSSAQLDATCALPGAFAYSPAAGTVLGAGPAQRLTATFTPADTAHYATVTVTATINVLGATASFVKQDTTTQGNWIGPYGSQGYDVLGNGSGLPSYATVTPSGASSYTWPATSDPSALEDAAGTGRIASCWYSNTSFSVDVNLTDGQQHLLSVYAADFGKAGRSEQIQILDPTTGGVLDTENLWSFGGGAYLQWVVSGHVVIRVTGLAGPNAVISGLFLDPQGGPVVTATASFVKQDTTTQGDWIGPYGSQGYDVLGNGSGLPSYATVTPSGASSYTWPATSDPSALEDAVGTGRIASCLVLQYQFHRAREPDRRPAAPALPVRGRFREGGSERADPDPQCDDGGRAGHREPVVVRRRGLSPVGGRRQHRDQGDRPGRGQRRDQRAFLDVTTPTIT